MQTQTAFVTGNLRLKQQTSHLLVYDLYVGMYIHDDGQATSPQPQYPVLTPNKKTIINCHQFSKERKRCYLLTPRTRQHTELNGHKNMKDTIKNIGLSPISTVFFL